MRRISKTVLWMMLLCIVLGAAIVLAGQWTLHKASSTGFCLSCYTIQAPCEEYTDLVHLQNQKGIRAKCTDCHISEGDLDSLAVKLRISKSVHHQFIAGKIDTPKKLEEYRLETAQTTRVQLKANDSATRRSCHSTDAMDLAT